MSTPPNQPAGLGQRGPAVLIAVGALGFASILTQLVLMRELLCAFAGNELVLGLVLGGWLLLTGLGAAGARWCPGARDTRAEAWLLSLQVLAALTPLFLVFAVRAWRDDVFLRGAALGPMETGLATLVVLLPIGVVTGACLTLASHCRDPEDAGQGLGTVFVADCVGSLLGGLLFTFVLVNHLGHIALVSVGAALNLVGVAALGFALRRSRFVGLAAGLGSALVTAWLIADWDAYSTALQYRGQVVRFQGSSPYCRLVVTESAGQLNFIQNGVTLATSHDPERAEEAVHFALAQRPNARRVLVIGGTLGGAPQEVLKYGVDSVTAVELDPLVLQVGHRFLPPANGSGRLHHELTDGRSYLRAVRGHFDVVLLDLPDPSTVQLNRFFTAEFFAEVRRALAPEGVVSLALGRYENVVGPELALALACTRRTLETQFRNVGLFPASRVVFVASNGALTTAIADVLEARQIRNQWLTRTTLKAMLMPDRLADMDRATAGPARLNRDFEPVLYFHRLRHWLSQFGRVSLFGLMPLGVGLVVYGMRLPASGWVVAASGFTGAALEVVLLLACQVWHGSMYREMGLLVTAFMAGLAVGAAGVTRAGRSPPPNRARPARPQQASNTPSSPEPPANHRPDRGAAGSASIAAPGTGALRAGQPDWTARRYLAGSALGLAALAVLLPWLLQRGDPVTGSALSWLWDRAGLPLLMFGVATLAGMQLPLAARLEAGPTVPIASRLYTADFVGGALGAVLAGTWLLPQLGVTGTCGLVGALNLLGVGRLLLRKGKA